MIFCPLLFCGTEISTSIMDHTMWIIIH